ncbi:MAG: sigma-54 dependent transcriptional regulator, partial [Candidatus Latescibacterota bacterium]
MSGTPAEDPAAPTVPTGVASTVRPLVLAVDDQQPVLRLLQQALADQGYEVRTAASGAEALEAYRSTPADVVLLDLHLPRMPGIEVLVQLRRLDAEATVIIMTGYGSVESAVSAMKAGAADYLVKPLDLGFLEVALERALARRRERGELSLLREQVLQHQAFEGMVGVSPPMQRLYDLVRRVAASDATVLIQGETGTGKELVARAIHRLGSRCSAGFVAANCGALPEGILESELFGHERGAFTGAVKLKYGLLEQAGGGTLFLDEIEAMSPALQVKLLRAVQEREVMRVGGDRAIPVDFRLLAATNADLRQRTSEGGFRPDLFYRLSVVTVDLPPLRSRVGDVALLAGHFLRRAAATHGRPVQGLTLAALRTLEAYPWPGNVRELANVIEQAVVLA